MNKKLFLISLLAIGIFSIVLIIMNQRQGVNQDEAYVYSSRDEALSGGFHEITGESQSLNDIHSWMLETTTNGNKEYCIFAVPYEESGIQKHYSFVALVEELDGEYAFFKMTADVSLNPSEGTQDQEETDSLAFYFDDVDNYYICVGKVFRDGVAPFVNDRQLAMNQDGIFSYFNQGKRPVVSIAAHED